VRIRDAALVSAAVLSHRYIADRFLPDKAIDLVDEAAAKIRLEIDSMPVALDELERRRLQLEIEREGLRREQDSASKERRKKIEAELRDLQDSIKELRARWESEKQRLSELRATKTEREQVQYQIEQAEREANLHRAAELKYGKLPEIERKLKEQESALDKASSLVAEEVTEDDIAAIVSKWTGIPVSKLLEGEVQKLIQLEKHLHERVVGQDAAVSVVSNAVRRARAGMKDPNRPIGSFLFLGPTGVGKTELAKALAAFLFDDEQAMVRVDMSEYQERHTVARLLGAPPGYVGYDEGGQLTEAVRRRPYSCLLLDEVEKAHPDVFNVLLQVLDDGRLTDAKGRMVDFKNVVVIMTSNLPVDMLREHFRPEFLNRIDEIVVFDQLGVEQLKHIVELQLSLLNKRMAERKIQLRLTEAAQGWFAEKGYDPIYGARPLKRLIQRQIENELAMRVLQGDFSEGSDIVIDIEDDKPSFREDKMRRIEPRTTDEQEREIA
jgi:ATP-dependent Clp protease ATP-binding subunit ClpB